MAGLAYSLARQQGGKRALLEQQRSAMWTDRSSFDAHWRELGDFLLPRRTRFWPGDRNRGDKRNQNIIDSTARFSTRTLASGLHAGLTSPARPWFKLTTPDPQLARFKPVQVWLEEVTTRMRIIFETSNLYNVLPTIYGDMGVFGTAAMSMLIDDKQLMRCTAYPIGSFAIALDRRNLATSFIREYELTVLQTVQEFGVQPGARDIDWTHLSPTTKALWDKGQYTDPVRLIWAVQPNPDHDPARLASKFKKWESCHYEIQASSEGYTGLLRESGFDSFPFMCPRWDVTGEDSYGTDCPGMTALGDVKQLQLEQRRKGQAINKMVDPPLKGAPELRTQKTSLLAGDITYVREPQHGLSPIHEVRLDISHLTADIREVQYRIQRAFYEDLFLMLARDAEQGGSPITAREVEERHEEKLLALGPVLERTNDELLDPLIDRAYELMDGAGLIPPPPPQLRGVVLKVEYISVMAQAQKLVGVSGQDRFMQSTVAIVEQFQEARNKIDVNQVIDNYGDMLGVDPRIIRTNEEADARTAQQAQAQQGAVDADSALKLATAAKQASGAQMGKDSALDRVVSGAVPTGQVA